MGVNILTGLDPTKIINALQSINENYEDITKDLFQTLLETVKPQKNYYYLKKNSICSKSS